MFTEAQARTIGEDKMSVRVRTPYKALGLFKIKPSKDTNTENKEKEVEEATEQNTSNTTRRRHRTL
jgi:hypothetical protein